ncbi:MAG TPA: penicillin-insensitive murein endopeptidase [Vicinamibacteria bacterium]
MGILVFAAPLAPWLDAADEPPAPEDPQAIVLSDPPPVIAGPDTPPLPVDLPPVPAREDETGPELEWDPPSVDDPGDEEVDDPGDEEAAAPREPGLHDYDPEEPAPETAAPTASSALLGRDEFRHLAITEPEALGALSIGTPDGGLLFNPVAMPTGDLWTVRDTRESFGTAETIDYIVAAIEAVEARYPGSPRLVIGDISRPDGGRLNRHKSHQAGRDADIGLYLRTGEALTLVKPGKNQLDLPRTWALLRAFVTDTDVERVFLDRALQRVLYAHALASGEDKGWLDDLFGRRDGGKNAIIQHERRHQDHMHVRFYNPHAQEKGRVAYPLLLAAGLVPGPTVSHRVRSGETLSHLAKKYGTSASSIRRANGLRSSFLRAGRKYVIPVRKAPTEGAPVAVPPRRLPPEEPALRMDLPGPALDGALTEQEAASAVPIPPL